MVNGNLLSNIYRFDGYLAIFLVAVLLAAPRTKVLKATQNFYCEALIQQNSFFVKYGVVI